VAFAGQRVHDAEQRFSAHHPNGKVDRSHRIDAKEFYRMLDGVVIDDTELFNDKLAEWERFYNFHRPHGSLGGQTPYERLRHKTTTPA
jgi:transposase InsO family protein